MVPHTNHPQHETDDRSGHRSEGFWELHANGNTMTAAPAKAAVA